MSIEAPTSDADVMDLLRVAGSLHVADLVDAMDVTPTAVRQRLRRLLAAGMIARKAIRDGRGRPKYRYSLTEKGLRQTGSNFTDLAVALWGEVSATADHRLTRDLLRRIAKALASGYAEQIRGTTPAERMQSLGELLARRHIPTSVEDSGQGPALRTHMCPYPTLAERDRSVCAMERMLFSEVLGQAVELTDCRLDGGTDCRFQVT